MGRRWDDEQQARLAELWNADVSVADIARDLGRSEHSIRQQAYVLRLKTRYPKTRPTEGKTPRVLMSVEVSPETRERIPRGQGGAIGRKGIELALALQEAQIELSPAEIVARLTKV